MWPAWRLPDGAAVATAVVAGLALGRKRGRRQVHKIRVHGWVEGRGAEQQARKRDPEAQAGAPVLRTTILLPPAETMDSARAAERHAHAAAGEPLGPESDTDPLPVDGLASAGELDQVPVFRVDYGAQTDRVSDAET